MSFTYDGALDTDLKKARFRVGDTDPDNAEFTDEEINYALTERGSVIGASSMLARQLASKYASATDKAVGDLKLSLGQRFEHFRLLAEDLDRMQATRAEIYAGGISIADKEIDENDTDRVDPAFTRSLHENLRNQPTRESRLLE